MNSEALQLLLLRQSLRLFIGVTVVLAITLLSMGAESGPAFAAAVVMTLCLQLLSRAPKTRRAVAWSIGLTAILILSYSAVFGDGADPAIVAILGISGIFLDGFALGAALLSASMLLFWYMFRAATHAGASAQEAAVIKSLASVLLMVSATGWHLGLRRAERLLAQAADALRQEAEKRERLVAAIFAGVSQTWERLCRLIGTADHNDWAQAQNELAAIDKFTLGVRSLRNDLGQISLDAPLGTDFSVCVLRAILWTSLVLAALGFVYHVILGQGPMWITPLVILVSVCGLFGLRRRVRAPASISWLLTATGVLTIGHDVIRDWGRSLTPTVFFWSTCMLNAGLLLGWRSAMVVAFAAFGTVAGSAFAWSVHDSSVWKQAVGLVFSFAIIGSICLHSAVRQRTLLRKLEEERLRLVGDLNQRRRLMGTLFHDIANPLTALVMICDFGVAGEATDDDVLRARRLLDRLGNLLREGRQWLLSAPNCEAEGSSCLAIDELFAGVQDLFRERLNQKAIRITFNTAPDLWVEASATAIGDGVLGNFLSNSIKFSPLGGLLELEAGRSGPMVYVQVSDRGPGISADLRERLAAGGDLPTKLGTHGETGQGLGLALAREHVERVGGRLELLDRDGGGLVARVWLKPKL